MTFSLTNKKNSNFQISISISKSMVKRELNNAQLENFAYQGKFAADILLQASLPMHHTLRLGVAVTELNLDSANSMSISEALVRRKSQDRPSVLFI